MIKIVVCGAKGRMGQKTISLLQQRKWQKAILQRGVPSGPSGEFLLVGAIEREDHPDLGKEVIDGINLSSNLSEIKQADIVINFTTTEVTLSHLNICQKNKIPIVIGTTGFKKEEVKRIEEISKEIPIFISPNMSLGANLLFKLTEETSKRLGPEFQVEIVEMHHKRKKDAPSGTALRLGEVVAQTRGKSLEDVATWGRKGMTGERKVDEIGIHSIRAGEIVGEHTVIFAGPFERLELTHRANSREAFAYGALSAALFLKEKLPGLYTMKDLFTTKARNLENTKK